MSVYAGTVTADGTVTAEGVLAQITTQGAESVRETYFSCWDSTRSEGYKFVEEGSEGWIHIGAILAKTSEGCYAIKLHSAIALAAVKNPEAVLKLVDSHPRLAAADICVPFLKDEFQAVKIRKQIAMLNNLKRAMKSVSSPELQQQKSKCLAIISAMEADSEAQLKRTAEQRN